MLGPASNLGAPHGPESAGAEAERLLYVGLLSALEAGLVRTMGDALTVLRHASQPLDSFVFDGLHFVQMRHVGNAVPPLMARALRDQVASDLLAAGVDRPRPVGRPKKPRVETREERSRIMRAVPSKNTSVERALRKALRSAGLRGYRLHNHRVPGTPDVVFGQQRLAVFVDGCFWHGCSRCYREPKSRQEYWTMKVRRNRDRDATVNKECKVAGWRVVRLWEHEVLRTPQIAAERVVRALRTRAVKGQHRGRVTTK